MNPTPTLVAGLVLLSVVAGVGVTPAAAQSDDVVTLSVQVITTGNTAVGGVRLVATWNGGRTTARTTANGRAFLDVPRAANVDITVNHPDYTRNEPYNIRVATEKDHTITVYRKATVDISVRDRTGPVADAQVLLRHVDGSLVSGTTTDDGVFDTGTIAQGRYIITVRKAGYLVRTANLIVAGSAREEVSIEASVVTFDFQVTDPHFSPATPVENASIRIRRVGTVTTDQNGTATDELPVNSDVEVTVTKEGYETVTRTVSVNETSEIVDLSLSREPSLTLTALNQRVVAGERVAVEVTNAYGEPASRVTILLDGDPVGETDSNGEATITIEDGGDHELSARAQGTTSDPVSVRAVSEATATEAETATDTQTETTESEGPGFGVVAALGALAALVLVATRSRRRR